MTQTSTKGDDPDTTKHVCEQCGEPFDTPHGLSVHQGHAHGAHTETCVSCGEDFKIAPSQADVREQCRRCFREHGFSKLTRKRIGRGVRQSKEN